MKKEMLMEDVMICRDMIWPTPIKMNRMLVNSG
jgi:hypothetical protein